MDFDRINMLGLFVGVFLFVIAYGFIIFEILSF